MAKKTGYRARFRPVSVPFWPRSAWSACNDGVFRRYHVANNSMNGIDPLGLGTLIINNVNGVPIVYDTETGQAQVMTRSNAQTDAFGSAMVSPWANLMTAVTTFFSGAGAVESGGAFLAGSGNLTLNGAGFLTGLFGAAEGTMKLGGIDFSPKVSGLGNTASLVVDVAKKDEISIVIDISAVGDAARRASADKNAKIGCDGK